MSFGLFVHEIIEHSIQTMTWQKSPDTPSLCTILEAIHAGVGSIREWE